MRAYYVAVPALYWGVQRPLRAVLTDEHQLPAADERAHRARAVPVGTD